MDDVAGVEVEEAVEELVGEGFEDAVRNGATDGLRMVVDYLLSRRELSEK